jgi:hypothetical protein
MRQSGLRRRRNERMPNQDDEGSLHREFARRRRQGAALALAAEQVQLPLGDVHAHRITRSAPSAMAAYNRTV